MSDIFDHGYDPWVGDGKEELRVVDYPIAYRLDGSIAHRAGDHEYLIIWLIENGYRPGWRELGREDRR